MEISLYLVTLKLLGCTPFICLRRHKQKVKHEEYPCIWSQETKPTHILLRRRDAAVHLIFSTGQLKFKLTLLLREQNNNLILFRYFSLPSVQTPFSKFSNFGTVKYYYPAESYLASNIKACISIIKTKPGTKDIFIKSPIHFNAKYYSEGKLGLTTFKLPQTTCRSITSLLLFLSK